MAKKKAAIKKPASSHVAMVKPTPVRPETIYTLEEILQLLDNDRPYTLISSHGNSCKVHFLGYTKPSIIKIVNGKPVITQEE